MHLEHFATLPTHQNRNIPLQSSRTENKPGHFVKLNTTGGSSTIHLHHRLRKEQETRSKLEQHRFGVHIRSLPASLTKHQAWPSVHGHIGERLENGIYLENGLENRISLENDLVQKLPVLQGGEWVENAMIPFSNLENGLNVDKTHSPMWRTKLT